MVYRKQRFNVFGLSSLLLLLVTFGFLLRGFSKDETHAGWLFLLFLIPWVVQILSLWSLNHRYNGGDAIKAFSWFYLFTMTACTAFYTGLWCCYISLSNRYGWEKNSWAAYTLSGDDWSNGYQRMLRAAGAGPLEWLSHISLIGAAVLVICVVLMTYSIFRDADEEADPGEANSGYSLKYTFDPARLKSGAAQAPFLALMFFFSVFLGVSYLFGFALAFHDKGQPANNPGLYSKSLYAPQAPPPPPGDDQARPAPAPASYTLKFTSGADVDPANGSLAEIVKKVVEMTNDGRPLRITITGHADPAEIPRAAAYKSNYELADARAQHARTAIIDKLGRQWHDIEWVLSSEPSEGESKGREVKVKIEQTAAGPAALMTSSLESELLPRLRDDGPRPLTMMDYVYFANYTITTTGYGDIIPNTSSAKFICSFANICEVFFLVVFFNALLSLKNNRTESELWERVRRLSAQVDVLYKNWKDGPAKTIRSEEDGGPVKEQSGLPTAAGAAGRAVNPPAP